ncbi:unnamed protein product, partial [marine sediment metagenome]
MIITLKQLKETGACQEFIDKFKEVVGSQTADFEFNQAAQGLMLADP